MGSPYPGCEQSVHDLNPKAMVCSEQHCSDFTESQTFHEQCDTFGKGHPLYPVSTSQCVNKKTRQVVEPIYDPTWGYSCPEPAGDYALQTCYCCCSCLAHGTPIAIPGGSKAIQLFNVGDAVTIGSYAEETLSWAPGSVVFSSGSDAGSVSTMVFIDCEDGRQLIASTDNLFLLAGGKLRRSDRLVPGVDQLMSADGAPIGITGTYLGKWTKGIHHIATGTKFDGTLDGHLLNAAGIVTGDYYLQVNQGKLVDSGLMEGAELSQALGSRDYAQANSHLDVTPAAAMIKGQTPGQVNLPKGFESFDPGGTIYVPKAAVSFLTAAQAEDIQNNKHAKFSDYQQDAGIDVILYLIKVFRGFYPEITILVDQGRKDFNAYAFTMYDSKYIVISGEIARLQGLYFQGYIFVIATLIARLLKQTPYDDDGFTYCAAADFYATSIVVRNAFYLGGDDLNNGILDQIQMVFGLISAENAGGNPEDLANDPSIRCRYANLRTGTFGGAVLGCATDDLTLEQAALRETASGKPSLVLTFDKPIDHKTATSLTHYSFKSSKEGEELPVAVSATVDDQTGTEVVVVLEHDVVGAFTVTVQGLVAQNGSTLGAQNSASF